MYPATPNTVNPTTKQNPPNSSTTSAANNDPLQALLNMLLQHSDEVAFAGVIYMFFVFICVLFCMQKQGLLYSSRPRGNFFEESDLSLVKTYNLQQAWEDYGFEVRQQKNETKLLRIALAQYNLEIKNSIEDVIEKLHERREEPVANTKGLLFKKRLEQKVPVNDTTLLIKKLESMLRQYPQIPEEKINSYTAEEVKQIRNSRQEHHQGVIALAEKVLGEGYAELRDKNVESRIALGN